MAVKDQVNAGVFGVASITRAAMLGIYRTCADGISKEGMVLFELAHDTESVSLSIRSSGILGGGGRRGVPYGELLAMASADDESGLMIFSVETLPASVKYLQAKALLVPIGPKQMIGWKTYEAYLTNVARAVRQADPYAQIADGRADSEVLQDMLRRASTRAVPGRFTETRQLSLTVRRLGVSFVTGETLEVVSVDHDSLADLGGMQSADVLVDVDGTMVTRVAGVQALLNDKRPGDGVALGWLRDGKLMTTVVYLSLPAAPTPDRSPAAPSVRVRRLGAGFTAEDELVVVVVDDGSLASRAGLVPGDILEGIDGQAMSQVSAVQTALNLKIPGDLVALAWRRAGQLNTANVRMAPPQQQSSPTALESRAAITATPRLGVPVAAVRRLRPDSPQAAPLAQRGTSETARQLQVRVRRLGAGFDAEDNLLLVAVEEGSLAFRAGLRSGDVLVDIEGVRVSEAASVRAILNDKRPGDPVAISWLRSSEPLTAVVHL